MTRFLTYNYRLSESEIFQLLYSETFSKLCSFFFPIPSSSGFGLISFSFLLFHFQDYENTLRSPTKLQYLPFLSFASWRFCPTVVPLSFCWFLGVSQVTVGLGMTESFRVRRKKGNFEKLPQTNKIRRRSYSICEGKGVIHGGD